MFSVQLYIRIFLQVVAIVLVAGLGVIGIVTQKAIILGIIALFIAAWMIALLVKYLNTSNRRIQLFLDAIEDNESMLYFPENIGDNEQRRLHSTFNRISHVMTENKRKEFEQELHRKEYEAWDKLMHVLTHEIMNSIAPIVSLSGTLLSYFRTKEMPKQPEEIGDTTIHKTIRGLNTIREQGQSLMRLTESYRRFSSVGQPVPKAFSLSQSLQDLQLLHQSDLQQIAFSIELYKPDIIIRADKQMLSQVLINLLKNAIQAVEGQSNATISIRVTTLGNELLIVIADNGPGIPSELLNKVFIPFFTTKQTGTGIGLSISRQIIRLHGGELTITSQPYVATGFRISLPSGIIM